MVTSYFDPLTLLIYAVGAVIGLIGGIKVYQKFSSGDPDTSKTAASWFGALYFSDCQCYGIALILPVTAMAAYNINKGVDARVEFHGLRAQYLYLFAGGLLGLFLLFVAMYLAGLSAGVCIFVCGAAGAALVWGVFRLNSRYGQYGMMKLLAGLRRRAASFAAAE